MTSLEKALVRKVTLLRIVFLVLALIWFFAPKEWSQIPYRAFLSLIFLIGINMAILSMQSAFFTSPLAVVLWFMELMAIGTVVTFTGGIYSPFIIMIFNPLLLGFYFKKKVNATLHTIWFLGVFICLWIPYKLDFSLLQTYSAMPLIIFVLGIFSLYSLIITTAFNHQNYLNHELKMEMAKNQKLLLAHESFKNKIKASLGFIEGINHVTQYEEIHDLLTHYLKNLFTQTPVEIFPITSSFLLKESYTPKEQAIYEQFMWGKNHQIKAKTYPLKNQMAICQNITANEQHWVIIALIQPDDYFKKSLIVEQLELVKEFHQIARSKLMVEELKVSLRVREEQNRIAEEMHDQVSANLFAISCGLFDVQQQLKKIPQMPSEILEKQDLNHKMMKETNQYLKQIIFKMSEKQPQNNHFKKSFFTHLDNLKTLHEIHIESHWDEDIFIVNSHIQTYVFRAVNELISNAIKHGKASAFYVNLIKDDKILKLEVTNNGEVFPHEKLNAQNYSGIGLSNMKKIAHQTQGYFKIENLENQTGMKFTLGMGGAYEI